MEKVLDVQGCFVEKQGVSQKTGKEYTIYAVHANDEHGTPIEHKLKSFQDIPVGRATYEVERQENEQYGPSFLVKTPNALTARLNGIEAVLQRELGEIKARLSALEGSPVPPPVTPAAAASVAEMASVTPIMPEAPAPPVAPPAPPAPVVVSAADGIPF
jgi:hypothetical protein